MCVIQTWPFSVIHMGITQSKFLHYTVGAQLGCSVGAVLLFFSFMATPTMQSIHYWLPHCFAAFPDVPLLGRFCPDFSIPEAVIFSWVSGHGVTYAMTKDTGTVVWQGFGQKHSHISSSGCFVCLDPWTKQETAGCENIHTSREVVIVARF